MDIILDTCAGVHAARMTVPSGTFLALLDRALGYPSYYTTNAIRTEWLKHGLAEFEQRISKDGRHTTLVNKYKTAQRRQRELRKVHKGQTPGVKDTGLLLLAASKKIPLVTDDADLYRMGRLEKGMVCFDLFDIALALTDRNLFTLDALDQCFTELTRPCPCFQPRGWKQLAAKGRTWPEGRASLVATRRTPTELAKLLGL